MACGTIDLHYDVIVTDSLVCVYIVVSIVLMLIYNKVLYLDVHVYVYVHKSTCVCIMYYVNTADVYIINVSMMCIIIFIYAIDHLLTYVCMYV